MTFFVSISTISHYKVACDRLISTLPEAWKSKYILIYQNENRNDFQVFDDGHIEVYITNNCSDYGNWIGLHMLISNNIVPPESSFLCIHDTCCFVGDDCVALTQAIIQEHPHEDSIWLCNNGQCNICILRRASIEVGYERYKNVATMTKVQTIQYEWGHGDWLSPKSFPVRHLFLQSPSITTGSRDVYNTQNERSVLFFPSIGMEKYFVQVDYGSSTHPMSP